MGCCVRKLVIGVAEFAGKPTAAADAKTSARKWRFFTTLLLNNPG
jgi:hypothetical protein